MPNPEITTEEIQEYRRGIDIKYFCKTYFDVDFDETKFNDKLVFSDSKLIELYILHRSIYGGYGRVVVSSPLKRDAVSILDSLEFMIHSLPSPYIFSFRGNKSTLDIYKTKITAVKTAERSLCGISYNLLYLHDADKIDNFEHYWNETKHYISCTKNSKILITSEKDMSDKFI